MKKDNLKTNTKWKNWKRPKFHFYFVLFATIVVMLTVAILGAFVNLVKDTILSGQNISSFFLMIAFGVVIGIILSFVIGLLLINPIKKLQSAMNEVAEGDLTITIEEKSLFDEIENINHSFNIMMKELRSNQMVQKDFISNVAHEFKTPLSTIDGYITLLQDESLSVEERNEYARIILETTASMSELVGNILLLSKTSNQGIVVDKNNFSLDEQIRKVVVLLEPKWSAKNIDFDVDLEEISVLSNENLMFNVWRNLIENAVKFTKEQTKITISLKTESNKIVFKVMDQGDGIDEDDKKYIFNKFYQADTSHKQEGNGLGLALVKDILTLFGGDITVENLLPNGCCFTAYLPNTIISQIN